MNLQDKAKQLRNDVLDMCVKAGTGHVSSCFSCVEVMVELFYKTMRPQDKFILSKGQASPLLYAILADKGFIPPESLDTFCQPEGMLGVHLDHHIPGALITSGSLGIGLGIGIGMAMANPDSNIYVLMGDGECQEGSVWEAAMFIGQHPLKNLKIIVDNNGWGVIGQTMPAEQLRKVWEAFGCEVTVLETIKGKGVSFMENNPSEWHGLAPQGEEARIAKDEISA